MMLLASDLTHLLVTAFIELQLYMEKKLTTRTDYVNSYPSTLQATSYNFSATETTGEICAGVVKRAGVFKKNAAQHAADLSML